MLVILRTFSTNRASDSTSRLTRSSRSWPPGALCDGFGWLTSHPRRVDLVCPRRWPFHTTPAKWSSDELRTLYQAAANWNRSDMWEAIGPIMLSVVDRTAFGPRSWSCIRAHPRYGGALRPLPAWRVACGCFAHD